MERVVRVPPILQSHQPLELGPAVHVSNALSRKNWEALTPPRAMDGEVRFASAPDRAAFTEELSSVLAAQIAKYHDGKAERGRDHRLIVAIHPSVKTKTVETETKES